MISVETQYRLKQIMSHTTSIRSRHAVLKPLDLQANVTVCTTIDRQKIIFTQLLI